MLQDIEKTIAEQMKSWPHLPEGFTKWLAENAWWLVLIGIVLGVMSVFSLLGVLMWGSAVIGFYGLQIGLGGIHLVAAWLSLAVLIVVIAIEAMAISPLKAGKKQGWDLLFLAATVSFVANIAIDVLQLDVASILGMLIGMVIGYYLLFEVRTQFVKPATEAKKSAESSSVPDEKTPPPTAS